MYLWSVRSKRRSKKNQFRALDFSCDLKSCLVSVGIATNSSVAKFLIRCGFVSVNGIRVKNVFMKIWK